MKDLPPGPQTRGESMDVVLFFDLVPKSVILSSLGWRAPDSLDAFGQGLLGRLSDVEPRESVLSGSVLYRGMNDYLYYFGVPYHK